jgi:hypothetical protein
MARVYEQVEWLSLVDISGPFLAGSVLEDVFPQGLDKVDTPRRQRLRAAYDEWRDAVDEGDPELDDLHAVWTRMIIREALEYEDEVLASREDLDGELIYRAPEHGVEIAPDSAVRGDDGKPRLLIAIHSPETDLEKPLRGDHWLASPAERMTLLCRANDVRIGLVTNGEQWMLVNAPIGSTSGCVTWFARLWWQEPVTFKAFLSLLGVRRCFGPAEEVLDRLLERSLDFQEEVTDTLGEQVRRAVEVLIQALGRADQDRNGELLKDVEPAELYESGLTVMMRLVFVLCAEERGLFLLGDPAYDQHYAVSSIRSSLREDESQQGPEVLERRHDAWSRMLAVFRAVYGGIEHETLRMPALGGSLFDPDRFPFLEGRAKGTSWREEPAVPLPIDNRTVLLLLTALQVLEQRGGAQLLSYRALNVEQIGQVYEGLLEYTVAKLPEVTVGLIGSQKDRHPTIGLSELEALQTKDTTAATAHLAELTGRSATAIRNSLERGGSDDALIKLIQDCGGDETLARRLLPFADLIRTDSRGSLLVNRAGSFAVTRGADRRETATHYTPRSLTESIVEKTLEPVAYTGPAEGRPRQEWKLRAPAELLDLKICDPAMGSGAFLVQVCRYLAERLVEAWACEEDAGRFVTVDGAVVESTSDHELLPKGPDDRLLIAKRLIAERCLYGVDLNPLAVELAKLSIWLVTLAKSRPFGFLDHNLHCGDSLLGIHRLEQLTELHMDPDSGRNQPRLFGRSIEAAVEKAIGLRKRLREIRIRDIHDVEAMAHLDEESRKVLEGPSLIADAFIGEVLRSNGRSNAVDAALNLLTMKADRVLSGDAEAGKALQREARQALAVDLPAGRPLRRPFHWPLDFPEVFCKERPGFDAMVGNPPFMGGRLVGRRLGMAYQTYLKFVRSFVPGSPDLCAYFILRSFSLIRVNGATGLLATKSIAETGSRTVALDQLLELGGHIFGACSRQRWPGRASVVVAVLWITKGPWRGSVILDKQVVTEINGGLQEVLIKGEPKKLRGLRGFYSQGQDIMGRGFELTREEMDSLCSQDPNSREVIRPLFNGQDLNTMPALQPYRWVIYFRDWPQEKAKQYPAAYKRVESLVKPYRENLTGQIHETCFWKFWDLRPRLMKEFSKHDEVLASAIVTKYVSFRRVSTRNIYNTKTKLYFLHEWWYFAVLQSTFHQEWATWRCGTLGATTLNYSTSAALETWPMPIVSEGSSFSQLLNGIGERYHRLRDETMMTYQKGLTDIYNQFHDPVERGEPILRLRELHVEMDVAVARAYEWQVVALDHGFYATRDGIRFTISSKARKDVFARLVVLNHERYEAENA